MKKTNISKKKYIAMCSLFIASIFALGISISYAILSIPVTGNFTESNIEAGDYGFTSDLDSTTAISESNLGLIEADEVEDLAPSASFSLRARNDRNDVKYNVYLKDIAISNNLIDSIGSFKWELLKDGVVIEQGDFRNIDAVGIKNSSNIDTQTTKYFESYDLKDGLAFDGLNTTQITFRVYILNDDVVDQTAMTNGTFQAKLGVVSYIAKYKCTRAKTLHTNMSATYGSLGSLTRMPQAGDAFDCDVNGDGKFDDVNERFYYVSDVYRNGSFNQNVAVLISANNRALAKWADDTTNGPTAVLDSLPTSTQWRNVSLSNTSRNIYVGNTTTNTSTVTASGFSYEGKAARLLTMQELLNGCPSAEDSSLSSCTWLLENTKYQDNSMPSGYWLETAYDSSAAWSVNGEFVGFARSTSSAATDNVVRPAIEVPYMNINY